MTTWAKNQIAKQLARFVKNLDPSQISLKFFKGEGELCNLELNEQVLTDLLELPPWLHLTKASCNRIGAKIHWTSLKTDPIRLFLDCVEVEIVASEDAVQVRTHQTAPVRTKGKERIPVAKASKYGFAEKVVDGMFVSINSVVVSFKASGFKASCSMSRFVVQSTDPYWNITNNLRKTRIKDEQRGEVLIFKEIKWGTMRLDADASYAETAEQGSIPIRLITNNSAIHLTIKKRLADCSLVSSRLELIFDDILWILTQSQLLKLSSFVHFLLKVRQKYLPMASHTEAPKEQKPVVDNAHPRRTAAQYQGSGHGTNLNKFFLEHDVEETSYHVKTNRIDLHLCDDQTLSGSGSSSKNGGKDSSANSGAVLISINSFRLDHYPYHIAGLKRKLMRNDDDALFSRKQWAQQLFDFFLKNEGRQHSRHPSRPIMYESFFLISSTNFNIMQVSTNERQESSPFLSSDKQGLFLPEDMNTFLLDFTTYYYIGYRNLPVPPSNMFLKLNPIKLVFHPLTCIWLNKFVQSVVAGLEWTKEFMAKDNGPPEHLDIRIESLMPQVTIPCETSPDLPHEEERPKALQVQISQAVVSNSRIGTTTSQSDLLMDVQNALASQVYKKCKNFPNSQTDLLSLPNDYWVNDYSLVHRRFLAAYYKEMQSLRNADIHRQNIFSNSERMHASAAGEERNFERGRNSIFSKDALMNPRIIWCIWCEQIWIDFVGATKSYGRPVTLLDAVPLRLWLNLPVMLPSESVGIDNGKETAACDNDDDKRVSNAQQHIKAPLVKTGSCSSLPATLNSPVHRPLNSNASSSSSMSVESASGNYFDSMSFTRNNENGQVDRGVGDASKETRIPGLSSPVYDEPVLRTSYSETDLILNHPKTHAADCASLQEFPTGSKDCPGPPPPYSASVSNSLRENPMLSSAESLPPGYSQIPTYVTFNGTENSDIAPPLPRKIPKEVIDIFTKTEDETEVQISERQKIPTIGCILQVTKVTNVQLDHFQLVFLLRLQEMFADMATKISEDTVKFQTVQSPVHKDALASNKSFFLHMSLPAVDVNIILPSAAGVHEEQLLSLSDRIESGKLTRFFELLRDTGLNEKRKPNNKEVSLSESKEHHSADRKSDALSQPQHSSSSSDKSSLSSASPERGNLHSQAEMVNGVEKKNHQRVMISQEKGSNSLDTPIMTSGIQSHVRSGTRIEHKDAVRYEKHTDALVQNARNHGDVVEDENNLYSDEFDVPAAPAEHVIIFDDSADEREMEEDANPLESNESETRLFNALREIVTSEAFTQTDDVETTVDGYEACKDERVSLICLKCKDIRVAIQNEDVDSVIKVSVGGVQLKEEDNISFGMTLDHRLSSAKGAEKDNSMFLDTHPQIQVRLLTGPSAEQFAEGAAELGFAHVKVSDLNATLLLSNAESLGEFVEDEYLLKKMPFQVELENVGVRILDNKPRRYLSAVLPPPMEVNVAKLFVLGSANGELAIGNGGKSVRSAELLYGNNGNERRDELYEDNLLRNSGDADSGIDNAENVKEQTAVIEENERLIDDLKVAKARLMSLEQERDAILKVVEKLQQELMWSNHENEKLIDKVRNYKIFLRDLGKR